MTAFKKVMKDFKAKTSSIEQVNQKEFTVTFEEPTTTAFDAMDFCPAASWKHLKKWLEFSTQSGNCD